MAEKPHHQVVGWPIDSFKAVLAEIVISRVWHGFGPALGKATDCKKRLLVS